MWKRGIVITVPPSLQGIGVTPLPAVQLSCLLCSTFEQQVTRAIAAAAATELTVDLAIAKAELTSASDSRSQINLSNTNKRKSKAADWMSSIVSDKLSEIIIHTK